MMKKKSGKRFLSWLLAAVMIIALMPANAFAKDDNDYGGIDTYANQSNNNVEFWCTNSNVNVGGKTSTSLDSLLSGKKQLVFSQETALQTGTLKNGSGLTGKLWKVMVRIITTSRPVVKMSIKPIQVLKSLPFGVNGNGYIFKGIDTSTIILQQMGKQVPCARTKL